MPGRSSLFAETSSTGTPNEKEIFLAARLLDAGSREEHLRQHCSDEAMRERIRQLLHHHDSVETAAGSEPAPAPPPGVPAQIEQFRIVREIGRGGMGVVYLAWDLELKRNVAIKVLPESTLGVPAAVDRFRKEARAAAALTHPSIVPVHESGVCGDRYYIVSEFVDGATLAAEITRRIDATRAGDSTSDRRTWRRTVVGWLAAIADGLEACRRAGIVHRDVKPSNILIDAEHGARLADFGIARKLDGDHPDATRTEATALGLIGSVHYMSPEQASILQGSVDHRSDIFSLGVVLHEALALQKPFEGGDAQRVLQAVITEAAPPLRRVAIGIDRDLETIVLKALEKSPEHRYPTAAHLGADLRAWLADAPILARRPGLARRTRQWCRAHRGVAMGAAGAVLASVTGLAVLAALAERDAKFARIDVEAPEGCLVFLQATDPETLEVELDATPLGTAPLRAVRLVPGQYRLTIATSDRARFAEFNLILEAPDSSRSPASWFGRLDADRIIHAVVAAARSGGPRPRRGRRAGRLQRRREIRRASTASSSVPTRRPG